ncbi:DUF4097 family beta strand repeat-containing protein [Nonomuraea africana]|uniref:DUF4097 and DUF4098 domain-containing protein YvlB n=1 Tax=Nonomuraea africana TaxID=46171 RepID=A0ABR9KHV2_9ACTN|nr:DUF4097 family beta strand repeat-containing protein [Nonomuraea africana]MBE1561594.1 DUF4097 and DUF4098 domain-containing protein YvlB [Nonomuraea africana]
MPVFATTAPPTVHVDFPAGELRVSATDRQDTAVEVRPAAPAGPHDHEYAQAVQIEHADGVITVRAPDRQRFRRASALHIDIALPEGSSLRAETASADVTTTGPLHEVDITSASGDVTVAHAATLRVKTASGDVRCDVTTGDAAIDATSGRVGLGSVGGHADVTTASGDAVIGRAEGDVTSRTASGDLVVRSVTRGQVDARSASGDVTVSVTKGTAAWLEVSSLSGRVSSELEQSGAPDDGAETLEVRARTLSGDIAILRAGSR